MSDDIHALSGAYAVDALDDVERARFERHLAGCTACQAEVESLVAAASELSVLTEATPPASLRAKVLADIATVRPLPPLPAPAIDTEAADLADRVPAEPAAPTAPSAPSSVEAPVSAGTAPDDRATPLSERRRTRGGPGRGWRVLVAAAAAAVLAVSGVAIWRQSTTDPSRVVADQVLAASDRTSTVKRFPDGSTATVWRSDSLRKAVLVTSGMPDAPSGKVYQLWLQDPTGHMASAGVMPPGADQVVLLDGDASKATGAGITLEPTGGSGQPTSDPIALFTFA